MRPEGPGIAFRPVGCIIYHLEKLKRNMKVSEAFGKNDKARELRKTLPGLSLECIGGNWMHLENLRRMLKYAAEVAAIRDL